MEHGTVEWNSGTMEWNSGMVEQAINYTYMHTHTRSMLLPIHTVTRGTVIHSHKLLGLGGSEYQSNTIHKWNLTD